MKNAALSKNAARKKYIFIWKVLGDFSSRNYYTLKIIWSQHFWWLCNILFSFIWNFITFITNLQRRLTGAVRSILEVQRISVCFYLPKRSWEPFLVLQGDVPFLTFFGPFLFLFMPCGFVIQFNMIRFHLPF